ncbi:tail fiber component H of prophage CP-933U [Escherichia coli]|nr:tail fiber component H of prophage CP-933U [Escherichia coli]
MSVAVWRQVAGCRTGRACCRRLQAEQADRALLRSLILTGGAAATTTAELWKMAGVISDEAGGGIRQAAENLARLAESGKYTAGSYGSWGNLSEMAADGGGRCREGGKSL